jgi:hypothetical protein
MQTVRERPVVTSVADENQLPSPFRPPSDPCKSVKYDKPQDRSATTFPQLPGQRVAGELLTRAAPVMTL